MLRYCLPLAGLLLAGCAPTPPIISKISDSSVSVQSGLGTTPASIEAEAKRGCGLYDKAAQSISKTCMDQYCIRQEFLFACH